MGSEKNFETRLKKWLEAEGIYPLGQAFPVPVPPCGYYEKRWGGGRYVKSGLPDMRIVVNGLAFEVELKASNGTPSELQKHNIKQINGCGGIGLILYPEGFDTFKTMIKGVKACPPDVPIAALRVSTVALSSTSCNTLMEERRSRTLTLTTPYF